MLSTGRLEVLKNDFIRRQLSNFVVVREGHRARHREGASDFFRLNNRHPDLIAVGRAPIEPDFSGRWNFLSGEGFGWDLKCDIEKMRASSSFLNDYVDNLGRRRSLIQSHEQQQEALMTLAKTLADELGLESPLPKSD